MTARRDHLSKAETVTIATIAQGWPTLVTARSLIADFQTIIRTRAISELPAWLGKAGTSLVASFARGVFNDEKAARAAMTSSSSNGQTEGQITGLKLVKRKMYGRGKINLLQAGMIGAP